MAQPSVVQHMHLQGVYSLLDDLQAGFLLVDPEGQIVHTSYWLRRLLPRRATKGACVELLGTALYQELCAPVLRGESAGERWRDAELEGRDEVTVQISVRSTQVEFADGRCGALLSLHDVSSEVGLHKQNKALLEKQKQINASLRKEIAKQLREHEDDISQLNEILQIAPSIFASFMAEAGSAIAQVESVIRDGPTPDNLSSTLRELHTLKGNSRSLGLNFIGGRAHSVEDLLLQLKSETLEKGRHHLGDLADLVEDLRRAKNRASFVRSRLRNAAPQTNIDMQLHLVLDQAHTALQGALQHTSSDSPAFAALAEAAEKVRSSSRIKLQELFEFLKAAAVKVSQGLVADCPVVDTHGGELTISPTTYAALASALPHLVRNAVCHGIESAEERLDAGKAALGLINIEASEVDGLLRICISDDGRGIDADKLKAIAAEQGLPEPTSPDELAAILLSPGVSTSDEVDQDKGRGMGSTAANEAIVDLGGTIAVESAPARGTTFTICVPLD